MVTVLPPLSNLAAHITKRPAQSLLPLLAIVMTVEFAQYAPEFVPGAHAVGEIVSNLCYALIGAIVFHWVIVEIPERRRRKATYEFHRLTFQNLLGAGPGLLAYSQEAARFLGKEFDPWDESSFKAFAKILYTEPAARSQERAGMLRSVVEVMMPRALTDLSASTAYLDVDVAHALSQFPRQDGLTMLQIRTTPSGELEPHVDAHITWSLVVAARRLYSALLESGAYDRSVFQASIKAADGTVNTLSDDILIQGATAAEGV